jgi:CTP:molybdopterin cytidylyltransferase MocA
MDIDGLAALAGNTIVAAAVTDAFEGVRAKVARIFGRDEPDSRIQRRLEETRDKLAAAAPEVLESAQATLARQWVTLLADLLADHPDVAAELEALIAEFRPALPQAGGNVTNTLSGTVSNGPVLMGRDFGHITIGRQDDPRAG